MIDWGKRAVYILQFKKVHYNYVMYIIDITLLFINI